MLLKVPFKRFQPSRYECSLVSYLMLYISTLYLDRLSETLGIYKNVHSVLLNAAVILYHNGKTIYRINILRENSEPVGRLNSGNEETGEKSESSSLPNANLGTKF